MGYRTGGRWVITGPVDKVTTALVAMRLEIPEQKDAGFDSFDLFKREDVGYIRFEFEQWKWYQDYTDVKWFESVWDWLDSHHEDFELSGKRVHIGEDSAIAAHEFGSKKIQLCVRSCFDDEEPESGDPLIEEENWS